MGLAGCTTTPPRSGSASSENTDKRRSINAGVDSTLARLYSAANGSRELVAKARGVLVFPSVIQAGFWIGGQYGEGALRVGGQTAGTAGGSFGLQIGAQSKAIMGERQCRHVDRDRASGGLRADQRRPDGRCVAGRHQGHAAEDLTAMRCASNPASNPDYHRIQTRKTARHDTLSRADRAQVVAG
jgi:hypothetical protein